MPLVFGILTRCHVFLLLLLLLPPLLLLLQVYLPELEAASRAAGVQDPDEVWEQFGQNVLAQRPEEPQQQSAGAGRQDRGLKDSFVCVCAH